MKQLQKFYGPISIGVIAIIIIILLRKRKPGVRLIAPVNTGYIDPSLDFNSLALRIRNAFYGIDWTSTKAGVITEMLALNNEELKYLYNVYNETYHSTNPNKTLVSDLNGEWIWGSKVNELKTRFRSLNLA